MNAALDVRPMRLEDLRLAVDWAASEGWNPGLEDAEAFHSVDPEGFLMGWRGDTPVSAISVVQHSKAFGFLGFYLCHPGHRGKGYGLATWQAGIAYLGDRTIGLDGVPAQQANYRRSGFMFAHTTSRYSGTVVPEASADCRPAEPQDHGDLVALDQNIQTVNRAAYVSAWVQQTDTRQTLVHRTGKQIDGFATIRACRQHHKIGPVFAPDAATASVLIRALAAHIGEGKIIIDVPDTNASGVSMATEMGLRPTFSCARMYRGGGLARRMKQIFGETTFEVG